MTSNRHSSNAKETHSLFSLTPKSEKEKICAEFGIVLPEHLIKENLFDNLLKERETFVLFNHCVDLESYDIGFIKSCWLKSVLNEDGMGSFVDETKVKLAEYCDDKIAYQKASKKIANDLNKMIKDPSEFTNDELMNYMKHLCRVDAHHTLELILSLYPNLVDIDKLLKEAIGCLHTDTVTTLIKLGADIHKPIRHSDYSDYDFQIFGSPLFYAFMLPLEPYSTMGRFGPVLDWSNPRYAKMLLCLLENGANPDQNCIFTDKRARDLSEAKQQEAQEEENCRAHAAKMLANEAFRKEATPFFIEVVNKIANWNYQPAEESRMRLA